MNTILLTAEANMALSEKMANAGINTLLGMGTVFIVLIIIMLVIMSFNLFNGNGKKKEEKKATTDSVDNAVAQISANEEASDDTELVAVIAAAIAAFEGSASTDGYVVRSIRRVR